MLYQHSKFEIHLELLEFLLTFSEKTALARAFSSINVSRLPHYIQDKQKPPAPPAPARRLTLPLFAFFIQPNDSLENGSLARPPTDNVFATNPGRPSDYYVEIRAFRPI